MPTTLRAGKNWVPNPSFEVDTAGWPVAFGAVITRVSTQARYGTSSAKLDLAATVNSQTYPACDKTDLALTGVVHVVTARLRLLIPLGVTLDEVYTQISYSDATAPKSFTTNIVGTGDWQDIVVPPLASDPAKTITQYYLVIRKTSAAAGYTIYVDGVDVRVDEPDADDYIDGSLGSGYAWTGTPHLSASTRAGAVSAIPTGGGGSGTQTLAALPKVARGTAQATPVSLWSAPIQCQGKRAIRFDMDIESIADGALGLVIDGWDPAKGIWITELTTTTRAAAGHYVSFIDPLVPTAAGVNVQREVPSLVRVSFGGTTTNALCSLAVTLDDGASDFGRVQTFVALPKMPRGTSTPNSIYAYSPFTTNGAMAIRLDHDIESIADAAIGLVVESWDPAKNAWVGELYTTQRSTPGHWVSYIDPRIPGVLYTGHRQQPAKRYRVAFGGASPTICVASVSVTLGA
jgi:hypothetical protein